METRGGATRWVARTDQPSESTKLGRPTGSPLLIAIFALASLFLAGCGGKKTPPPPPPPATASAPASAAALPVDLPRDSRESPAIRVLIKENFSSARIEGASLNPVVLVAAEAGRIRLTDASHKTLESGSGFRLKPARGLLSVDGVPYRGSVEVFINPLKQPVIVNELGMENYLRSVIPAELSPRIFPYREAQKTQAVAARTFAAASLGQNTTRGFDVYADVRSQVYLGVKHEALLSDRAIRETHGTVAVYDDRPIVAFYSSTCGGLTADYAEMFQRPRIPYLQGGIRCSDRLSAYHAWNERIRVSDIQDRLDRYAGVGRLKELEILRKSSSGRITEMRFLGSSDGKVLKGMAVRYALGLRSNWVTRLESRRDRTGYIVEIRVRGKGFGHGVGLCQIGAVELAREGWEFERILKYYYRGIHLKQQW